MGLAETLGTGVTCWRDAHAALVPHNQPGDPTAGYLFEEFAKYFFLAAPEYKGEFKNVWAETEIPPRVRKKLTLAKRDHGVDLLLEDHEGRFHAVQCKFKTDESKTLGWTADRLSSWLAESDEAQGLIMFTNASRIDRQSTLKASKKDFTLITVGDLVSLSFEAVDNILRLARGKAPKRAKRLRPRPHQRRAINDVVKGFKTHDRGQLILPCGAGKTLASLWLKERLGVKRTLVLVPSLALLRQIRREWAAQQKVRIPYLCVCSEKDIDKDKRDAIVTHTFEVPGHVTTQPDEIAEFASEHDELVVYSTYQSLQAVVDAGVEFDLAICDEAHKTATARHNEFALVHEDALETEKRLYMTATPRVLSPQAKGKLGEDPFDVIADMSDEETFGPEFHRMSFAEAIEADPPILSDYKIVVVGVSDRQVHRHIEQRTYLEDASADQVATSLALQKVMKKHGLAHALTFHSRVKRAKSFTELHKKRTRKTDVEHVNGSMSTNDRLVLLDEFKKAPLAVMTNARCLTEGVDVPAIDCVAFVDPKHSKVDIVQAAGRALRLPKGDDQKPYGVILIPIFYEVGEDPERIAASGIFRNVFGVVRAMADQDERLQAEITNIRLGLGKRRPSSARVNIDFGGECLVLEGFEAKLRASLVECIVTRAQSSWEGFVTELIAFQDLHGHMNVPEDAPEPWAPLGQSVERVRQYYRYEKFPDHKIARLEALGFRWTVEGQTLDETTGLLHERAFAAYSGFKNIQLYVKKGLISPVGVGFSTTHLSNFFHPGQAEELRRKLGITLKDTKGLIPEAHVVKMPGLGRVAKYRAEGKITPAGYALYKGRKPNAYYAPKEISRFKRARGITLDSIEGLLTIREVCDELGVSKTPIQTRIRSGELKPIGYAPGVFFSPDQLGEIRNVLELEEQTVDLSSYLTVREFALAVGFKSDVGIRSRLSQGHLSPDASRRARNGKKSALFRPERVAEFRRELGITLENTEGLLSLPDLARAAKVDDATVRAKVASGIVQAVGFGLTEKGSVTPFFDQSAVEAIRASIRRGWLNRKDEATG